MKRSIDVEFINVMISDTSNETHQINTHGTMEIKDGFRVVSFKDDKNQINMEIWYKDNHVLLKKIDFIDVSVLEFIKGKSITNNYRTPYGGIMLISKVLSYDCDNRGLSLLYRLENGNDVVGNYKLKLQFKERDNEH